MLGYVEKKFYDKFEVDKTSGELSYKEDGFNSADIFHYSKGFDDQISEEKRVVTGSYYTPSSIVDFMIDLSIKRYLEQNNLKTLNPKVIRQLKVVDLSCGTGALLYPFAQKIYEILIVHHKGRVQLANEDIEYFIYNNLYGIDIQLEPLTILTYALQDFLMSIGCRVVEKKDLKLYHHNAITDPGLFKEHITCKFDIVLGNPPYLGEKGNKEVFKDIRTSEFGRTHYEGKMDLFYYFIYRGNGILKANGVLTYISTNYFITANGGKKLRAYIQNEMKFIDLINFNNISVFPNVKSHNMIYTLTNKKGMHHMTHVRNYNGSGRLEGEGHLNDVARYNEYTIDHQSIYRDDGQIQIFECVAYYHLIEKILEQSKYRVGDVARVKQGIVSGCDKVTASMLKKKLSDTAIEQYKIKEGQGIFVFNNLDLEAAGLKASNFLKPFYKNSDIKNYAAETNTDKSILYLTDENHREVAKSQAIMTHLSKYKMVLDNRREVNQGRRMWTSLQWYRDQHLFQGEKIVAPQRNSRNVFAYSCGPWYGSADIYYIKLKEDHESDIQASYIYYLLGILNSKLMYFWLYNMGKRKGSILELYGTPISNIPVMDVKKSKNYSRIVEKTKKIIDTNREGLLSNERDALVAEIDVLIFEDYKMNDANISVINKTGILNRGRYEL